MSQNEENPRVFSDRLDDWTPGCRRCEHYRASYQNWLKDGETLRGRARAWCDQCGKWVRN